VLQEITAQQTQVAVAVAEWVAVAELLVLAALVVQAIAELHIGVNCGKTLRIFKK
jgi:hypothetical protein